MRIKTNYSILLAVLWLGAIGLFVRVSGLQAYYFSPDDVAHLYFSDWQSFAHLREAIVSHSCPPLMCLVLHILMGFSKNELLMRSLSLIPGVGLIFVFFCLGRRASGTFSGLAMAFMATFGYGAILLSQVIRTYSALIFFLSIGYWLFLSYLESYKNKYLLGYVFFMLLAILSNYVAVVPLAAIGLVHLAGMTLERKPAKEYAIPLLLYIPLLSASALSYLFPIRTALGSEYYGRSKATYLEPFFPETLSSWLRSIRDFYDFLFLPPNAIFAIILTAIGFYAFWRKGHRNLVVMIAATFVLNAALTALKLFPFGGGRQSIYLFPMVALAIGASIQYLFALLRNALTSSSRLSVASLIENYRTPLRGLAILLLIALTVQISLSLKQSDFLRRYLAAYGASWREFPLKRADYVSIMELLAEDVKPDDVILTNRLSSYYLLLHSGVQDPAYVSEELKRMRYLEADTFMASYLKIESGERLIGLLREITPHVEGRKEFTLWLANIGWDDPVGEMLSGRIEAETFIEKKLVVDGGFVFGLNGKLACRQPEEFL